MNFDNIDKLKIKLVNDDTYAHSRFYCGDILILAEDLRELGFNSVYNNFENLRKFISCIYNCHYGKSLTKNDVEIIGCRHERADSFDEACKVLCIFSYTIRVSGRFIPGTVSFIDFYPCP